MMCDFGREASPKAGLVEEGWDIAAEHDFHAQNAESAGSYVTGAFAREKLCIRLFGGANRTRTPVHKQHPHRGMIPFLPLHNSLAVSPCLPVPASSFAYSAPDIV